VQGSGLNPRWRKEQGLGRGYSRKIGSREAAQECSPRRKPWVCDKEGRAPTERKTPPHTSNQHPAVYGFPNPTPASNDRASVPPRSCLCRPFGACRFLHDHPRLTPWAAFLRRFAAGFGSCGSRRCCPSTTSNTLSAKEPALSCPPDSQFGIPFRHL
jgi:hypothetical protein